MNKYESIKHTFEPVYNEESRVLILGTFPSVKSREEGFYYYHPRNRFWNIVSALRGYEKPETIEEKKKMLLRENIAIWDVISSCDIVGSSDSSIKNVVPADIAGLVKNSKVKAIFANGRKAEELYNKYAYNKTGINIIGLPSTSPANAAFSLERLLEEWYLVNDYLK